VRLMYDASYPPPAPPAGWQVVAGYLGGDTPHVWSPAEWASQPARYRLGIWTRDDPAGYDAAAEARAALAAWQALGAPAGSTIALDFEAAVDGAYVQLFDATLVGAGYRLLLYGQQSTVLANPQPSAGYWVADWTGTAPTSLPSNYGALQYASYNDYDASVVADTLPLWDTALGTEDLDMPLQLIGTIPAGPQPVTVLPPSGVAWTAMPQRALHLGYDNITDGVAVARVRVALHSQAKGWYGIQVLDVPVRHVRVSVDFDPDVDKISLQTTTPNIGYAIEVGAW
jgi:hypothetical protein